MCVTPNRTKLSSTNFMYLYNLCNSTKKISQENCKKNYVLPDHLSFILLYVQSSSSLKKMHILQENSQRASLESRHENCLHLLNINRNLLYPSVMSSSIPRLCIRSGINQSVLRSSDTARVKQFHPSWIVKQRFNLVKYTKYTIRE